MGKSKNIIGQKFGKLEVVSFCGYNPNFKNREETYLCKCDCGNETIANKSSLLKGTKKSCGCLIGKNRFVDLTGKKFGKLLVIKRVDNVKNKIMYLCRCDCGNEVVVQANHLRDGHSENCRKCLYEGVRYTRLYKTWCNMKSRCYNKNTKAYKDYGGRGITICPEWLESFDNFKEWAYKNGWDENKDRNEQSIDRINNDGNYEPSNCRFTDVHTQANNRRNSKK